ncbi:coiled-coil domain-containing protein 152 [Myripristis murdjan]|uniref:coiled-coil domain-containing protein 152 n=1 Tax=Myripristis murdjan TaxID=586833 RepID=UPI00117645E7|nr:coiled-coil domain-containing protein 152 [Myripristis murdjan]
MQRLACVKLDILMENFARLEQKVTDLHGKNNSLEIKLEEATRLLNFNINKVKSLTEERDNMLDTVNKLQLTLQEQSNLRVENEKLKGSMEDLKRQNEKTAEERGAEVQRLLTDMKAEEERHQRELETVRQQCSTELDEAHKEALNQLEAKDAEVQKLLARKDLELEEMKKKLRDQEKERQSELLKLQMEFGAKLAKVQSAAQSSQLQQSSSFLPQSVFRKKLQVFQEEKNKEIAALRHRIKELEEHQRAGGLIENRPKRKKM